jgi:hypothetical protein
MFYQPIILVNLIGLRDMFFRLIFYFWYFEGELYINSNLIL